MPRRPCLTLCFVPGYFYITVMETSNNYYLVLEFADGGEFMRYLCEKRKLSERECRKYIRQLVSAVDHMHKADIIHR